MYSTLLLSALVALVGGSSPPTIKRQDSVMEVEIKFGSAQVPMGVSLDTINNGFEQGNSVCDSQSCNPDASIPMEVGVVLPFGVYPQADKGALTIVFDGSWDTDPDDVNFGYDIRDTLIHEMRHAATGVASMQTVTVRTKIGSSGKSCDINPAACKDDEFKDFDVYTVPDKFELIGRKDGKIIAEMTASLSIVIPELNLGPFNCNNAQTYADKVLSTVPVIGEITSGVCSLKGIISSLRAD